MQVLIVKDVEHALIASCYGKTWAEKRNRYPHTIDPHYTVMLTGYQGMWVPVDTKYLFDMSFNVVLDNNGMFDVQHYLVDKVDIYPEFNSFEQWVDAVKERYERDWPGTTTVEQHMAIWKDRFIINKQSSQ